MKIVLVVNAECEDDYQGKIVGRRNVLLNDTGRRSVMRLKPKLDNYKFDICFISPLIRCFETAIMLVGDKTEIIRDDHLTQREMGELDGRSIEEYNAYKFWDYKLNRDDYGVEPIHDLFSRTEEFLELLKKEYSSSTVLIVCQDENYRALRHLLLNHELKGNLLDGKIKKLSMEEFEA